MTTTITPLRRFVVTAAMIGAAVFGSVALAPAASADESTPVAEQVPVVESTPVTESAPVTETVPAPQPAPVVEPPAAAPAPLVEQAPAPQVTPAAPPVVYDRNGNPVKPPKACTAKELEKIAKQAAQADRLAGALNSAALKLREAAVRLRAEALQANAPRARVLHALANRSDAAAGLLEGRAALLLEESGVLTCTPATGERF